MRLPSSTAGCSTVYGTALEKGRLVPLSLALLMATVKPRPRRLVLREPVAIPGPQLVALTDLLGSMTPSLLLLTPTPMMPTRTATLSGVGLPPPGSGSTALKLRGSRWVVPRGSLAGGSLTCGCFHSRFRCLF